MSLSHEGLIGKSLEWLGLFFFFNILHGLLESTLKILSPVCRVVVDCGWGKK